MPVPDLSGERALVTGGAGFIGSHLVDALIGLGAHVVVLDDFSTGDERNLEAHAHEIELVTGDIRDLGICSTAAHDCTYVFHQAALGSVPRSVEDPSTSMAVNALGTAHVFEAARQAGVRRVVYASSSSVYGDSASLPKREGEEGHPLSPYAASKVMSEQIAGVFATTYGVPSVGMRYFNVYGPRQSPEGPYAAVIPRFFAACLSDRPPTIYGDGEQTRDFTFVGDVVQANLLAAGSDSAGHQAVNVAGGLEVSINEMARTIAVLTGSDQQPEYLDPRPGDVRHSLADLARARALGFEPRTTLADGLEQALSHFRTSLRVPS